jgi:multidrug transporter EmrE-like cation transporter
MLAIAFELLGTNCAKLSAGLRVLRPTLLMYVTYGISVSCLAAALNNGGATSSAEGGDGSDGRGGKAGPTPRSYGLDLGAAYAAWSGIGTIVAALLGVFLYGETLVPTQVAGILLTIVGVAMVNLVPSSPGAGGGAETSGADGSMTDFTVSTAINVGIGTSNTYGSLDGVNYTKV